MLKKYNLIGQKFGHLTVTELTEARQNHYQVWWCKCDCGGEILVNTRRLKAGIVTDCGCIPKSNARRGNTAEDLTGQRFG